MHTAGSRQAGRQRKAPKDDGNVGNMHKAGTFCYHVWTIKQQGGSQAGRPRSYYSWSRRRRRSSPPRFALAPFCCLLLLMMLLMTCSAGASIEMARHTTRDRRDRRYQDNGIEHTDRERDRESERWDSPVRDTATSRRSAKLVK